jgi:hypothetical protein
MLRMSAKCDRCGYDVLPSDCRCDEARRHTWLDLDWQIWRHVPGRRPWEGGRTVLPPDWPGDDVWTERARERWRRLEAAVKQTNIAA